MAGDLSDDEKRTLLESFIAATGLTDQDRARFYLESANWNIDVAAEGYFGDADAGPDIDLSPASSRIAPSPEVNPTPQATGRGKEGQSSKSIGGSSRIATIGSLAHDSHSDDSDDETGETYYAGGSERSGQQVIGPPRKGAKSSGKLIDGVFKAAKERGAETVESPLGAQSSSSTGGRSAFQGTAYRLGDTSAPSERIDDQHRASAASASRDQVDVTLYMWRNGFSVDDGPMREFQSPDGQQFLECIKNGEVPRELISAARGAEVSLSMVDRRTEDFVAPKKTVKSFAGEGHRLGSPTDLASVPASLPPVSTESAASQQRAAEASVNVDASAPITSIQIRLSDGSRLVGKFNQSHTVSDVRRYITTARPEYSGVEFTLMTTFPNNDLTDESQSLSTAGLLNAVLVVKPAKK